MKQLKGLTLSLMALMLLLPQVSLQHSRISWWLRPTPHPSQLLVYTCGPWISGPVWYSPDVVCSEEIPKWLLVSADAFFMCNVEFYLVGKSDSFFYTRPICSAALAELCLKWLTTFLHLARTGCPPGCRRARTQPGRVPQLSHRWWVRNEPSADILWQNGWDCTRHMGHVQKADVSQQLSYFLHCLCYVCWLYLKHSTAVQHDSPLCL